MFRQMIYLNKYSFKTNQLINIDAINNLAAVARNFISIKQIFLVREI